MRPPSGLIHEFTILYSVIDLIVDVPSATGDFLRQMAFFDSIRPCRQDIFLHAAAPCGGHCLLICLVRSATRRDRRRKSWPWMRRRSKSRSGGGQGRTSPTGASCPTMSAGRPWICRRIFSVSLTLTAESSTEMKARQGYRPPENDLARRVGEELTQREQPAFGRKSLLEKKSQDPQPEGKHKYFLLSG